MLIRKRAYLQAFDYYKCTSPTHAARKCRTAVSCLKFEDMEAFIMNLNNLEFIQRTSAPRSETGSQTSIIHIIKCNALRAASSCAQSRKTLNRVYSTKTSQSDSIRADMCTLYGETISSKAYDGRIIRQVGCTKSPNPDEQLATTTLTIPMTQEQFCKSSSKWLTKIRIQVDIAIKTSQLAKFNWCEDIEHHTGTYHVLSLSQSLPNCVFELSN